MKTFQLITAISMIMMLHSISYGQSWLLNGNGGTTNANFLGTTDNKKLTFKTNNLTRITITPQGKVGIGIGSATELLHVGGRVRIDEAGPSFLQLNSTGLGNVTMQFNQQGVQRVSLGFDNSTNDFVIATDDLGLRPDFIINRTDGNVGIGTKTPSAKLHLLDGDFEISNGGNNFLIRTNTSGQLDLIPNNSTNAAAITINDDNSFVGIGTSAPAYRLEVNGDIKCGGDFITNATDGVINVGGAINANVNVIGDADNHVQSLGDEDLYIQDDIEIGGTPYKPGGGSWSATSDSRLKKDIKPFTDGLEQVLKINPVWFKYNDKMPANYQNKDFVGVIAQEIKEVAPYTVELKPFKQQVSEAKGNESDPSFNEEYYVYDPSSLPYMLINAMKEQQKVIESLQLTVNNLQSEIETLKSGAPSEPGSLQQKSSTGISQVATLEQNIPNPAAQSTTIRYTIPSGSTDARVVITDQKGIAVQTFENLIAESSQLEVSLTTLSPGTYQYTLYIAGKKVDTKQMIISK